MAAMTDALTDAQIGDRAQASLTAAGRKQALNSPTGAF